MALACIRVARPRTGCQVAKRPRTIVRPRAGMLESANQLANDMYFVSKGVILFTMFYCSMNWWHYRRMRDDFEKERCDAEKKNKK